MIMYHPINEHIWLNDKRQIESEFKIKDMNNISTLLSIEMTRSKDQITLHQKKYVETIVQQHKLEFTKSISNPCSTTTKNLIDESIINTSTLLTLEQIKTYQCIIGQLNYLSGRTRPDISFITNLLSRFIVTPYLVHLKAAIRVLTYLKNTSSYGIIIRKNKEIKEQFVIKTYCDASNGSNEDFKSTIAYVTTVNV